MTIRRRIGIYGGSFNPIHNGHIALARQIQRQACLDEVWMMVSPQNPLKQGDNDLLDDQLRWEMTCEALKDEPGLRACDVELQLPKPSYTWHTLQVLERQYPDEAFTLVIGADNWQLFPRWYHSNDILKRYPVVVYPREGYPIKQDDLPENVLLMDTELYLVSSTDIRRRIREGLPIDQLVPKAIAARATRYYQTQPT